MILRGKAFNTPYRRYGSLTCDAVYSKQAVENENSFHSRDEIDVAKRYTAHAVRFAVVLAVMLKSITVTIVHTPVLASLAVFLQGAAERVRWVV